MRPCTRHAHTLSPRAACYGPTSLYMLVGGPEGCMLVGGPEGCMLVGGPEGCMLVGGPEGCMLVGGPEGCMLVGGPEGIAKGSRGHGVTEGGGGGGGGAGPGARPECACGAGGEPVTLWRPLWGRPRGGNEEWSGTRAVRLRALRLRAVRLHAGRSCRSIMQGRVGVRFGDLSAPLLSHTHYGRWSCWGGRAIVGRGRPFAIVCLWRAVS